jgi:glycosyltransferase involved in cell wall biosynthesis
LASVGDAPIDIILHVRNIYFPTRRRYAAFIDSTLLMAERGWANWSHGTRLERRIRLGVERRYYAQAQFVFTAGHIAANSVISDYGVDPTRVVAIGGGVNFDPLPELSKDARSSREILWVGLDFERKGGDLLMQAFRRVRSVVPDARLVLVGASPQQSEPGVDIRGEVRDRDELAQLYRRATLFCLPARHEPYGLVVQEAMAFGLPCIVSDVGELGTIVTDGVTGIVMQDCSPTKIADAIISLMASPDGAQKLGDAGRVKVESSLTWEAVASRMLDHLDIADQLKGP